MLLRRILLIALLLLQAWTVVGQEVLNPSRINARANRKYLPALGLPQRSDGEIDAVIRFRDGRWEGRNSAQSTPNWTMFVMGPESPAEPKEIGAALEFCRKWANDKPKGHSHVVYGPFRGGWFVAVCKKDRPPLGWKSLAFVIPLDGIDKNRSIYLYSKSVNWLEHFIGYNLFPKLPDYCQEIVEEITATELLCPYQEFETELERPDPEIEYDWEQDVS